MPRKRISSRSDYEQAQERAFLDSSTDLLRQTFKSLNQKVRLGDIKAIEISLQLHQFLKQPGGGINITQQVATIQQSSDSQPAPGFKSFESIVRDLETRDPALKLPAPSVVLLPESRKVRLEEHCIIDATPQANLFDLFDPEEGSK